MSIIHENNASEGYNTVPLWDGVAFPEFTSAGTPTGEFLAGPSLKGRIGELIGRLVLNFSALFSSRYQNVANLMRIEDQISLGDRKIALIHCGLHMKHVSAIQHELTHLPVIAEEDWETAIHTFYVQARQFSGLAEDGVTKGELMALHRLKPGTTSYESDFQRTMQALHGSNAVKLPLTSLQSSALNKAREEAVTTWRNVRIRVREFKSVGLGDEVELKRSTQAFIDAVGRWRTQLETLKSGSAATC